MARRIKFEQIPDYAIGNIEQLLRVTVLETDNRLKLLSPVDTGRFRASWQVGKNSTPGKGAPEGQYGQQYPIQRIGYNKEEIGNVYSIHNNLPYAEKLALGAAGAGAKTVTRYDPNRKVKTWASPGGGSSIQTGGPGWIQQIAKDMQKFVLMNAARIGRTQ